MISQAIFLNDRHVNAIGHKILKFFCDKSPVLIFQGGGISVVKVVCDSQTYATEFCDTSRPGIQAAADVAQVSGLVRQAFAHTTSTVIAVHVPPFVGW